jgi:hypothetical protein
MAGMTGFAEWIGRVVMLVLAGMITLSIIGAIAAIPSGSIETRFEVEQQNAPRAAPADEPVLPPSPAPSPPEARPPGGVQTGETRMVEVPQPKPTAADWLEAITYALLALVGLAAVGILLLWRALRHWRRSADALEDLAARRP